MPYMAPSKSSPTPIWALHHHQGCGWQCFCAQHSPFPLPTPILQHGSPSTIFPTIFGHLRDSRVVDTNKAQPWLHATFIQWSDFGDTNQQHPTSKDPILLSCQSRETPAPRQVTHSGPNSTEISSIDGGNQCNWNHLFLRREYWSKMDVVFLPPIPTGSFRKFSSLGVLFSWFSGP